MAGFDPSPIRRLVEQICADPELRLLTTDGRIVRPLQPPAFESLPHPDKVCQAAVKVVHDGGAPFNISLCDLSLCDPSTLCDTAEALVGAVQPVELAA